MLTSEATARQSPVRGFDITPPGGGLAIGNFKSFLRLLLKLLCWRLENFILIEIIERAIGKLK